MTAKKYEFKTPVLFLIFNRLDSTKKVLAEIRKVKPKKFFIAADGPRTREGEIKIKEVRNYVLQNIDWVCSVKTLFRKNNLGCREATKGAIDWFFENVDEGIVLEDDNLPNQSFFRFCQEMLIKYRHEEKIMTICGYNRFGNFKTKDSYFFSRYPSLWGFALWKRSWKLGDLELKKFNKLLHEKRLNTIYPGYFERILRKKRGIDCLKKRVNSWAIPWSITHQILHNYAILPRINLVKNIGFKPDSTHTKANYWDKHFLNHNPKEMVFPLKHPKEINENKKFLRRYIFQDVIRILLKRFLKSNQLPYS